MKNGLTYDYAEGNFTVNIKTIFFSFEEKTAVEMLQKKSATLYEMGFSVSMESK